MNKEELLISQYNQHDYENINDFYVETSQKIKEIYEKKYNNITRHINSSIHAYGISFIESYFIFYAKNRYNILKLYNNKESYESNLYHEYLYRWFKIDLPDEIIEKMINSFEFILNNLIAKENNEFIICLDEYDVCNYVAIDSKLKEIILEKIYSIKSVQNLIMKEINEFILLGFNSIKQFNKSYEKYFFLNRFLYEQEGRYIYSKERYKTYQNHAFSLLMQLKKLYLRKKELEQRKITTYNPKQCFTCYIENSKSTKDLRLFDSFLYYNFYINLRLYVINTMLIVKPNTRIDNLEQSFVNFYHKGATFYLSSNKLKSFFKRFRQGRECLIFEDLILTIPHDIDDESLKNIVKYSFKHSNEQFFVCESLEAIDRLKKYLIKIEKQYLNDGKNISYVTNKITIALYPDCYEEFFKHPRYSSWEPILNNHIVFEDYVELLSLLENKMKRLGINDIEKNIEKYILDFEKEYLEFKIDENNIIDSFDSLSKNQIDDYMENLVSYFNKIDFIKDCESMDYSSELESIDDSASSISELRDVEINDYMDSLVKPKVLVKKN